MIVGYLFQSLSGLSLGLNLRLALVPYSEIFMFQSLSGLSLGLNCKAMD